MDKAIKLTDGVVLITTTCVSLVSDTAAECFRGPVEEALDMEYTRLGEAMRMVDKAAFEPHIAVEEDILHSAEESVLVVERAVGVVVVEVDSDREHSMVVAVVIEDVVDNWEPNILEHRGLLDAVESVVEEDMSLTRVEM